MRHLPRLLAPALFVSLIGCGPTPSGSGDDDDDTSPDAKVDAGDNGDGTPATEACRKMDLIFIIDDSGSMAEEQGNLATNFPMFANLLNTYTTTSGDQLDYRAAITTTGITATFTITPPVIPGFPPLPPITQSQVGDNGKFKFAQSCGMTRRWLERTDPNMAQTFACAANVGTNGPGLEMPLRAAELAAMVATNPGFLRDDALLGIVIVTDEDDCSRRSDNFTTAGDGCATNNDPGLMSAQDMLGSLDLIKGERGRWAAAVIAARTSCTSAFGDAAEGIRLKQFAAASPDNIVFGDICAGNLAGSLQAALDTFQAACDNFPPIGKSVHRAAVETAGSAQ